MAIFFSHAGAPLRQVDQAAYEEYEFGTGAQLHLAAVELVTERCSICHAHEPQWKGLAFAPKGIVLESEADILAMSMVFSGRRPPRMRCRPVMSSGSMMRASDDCQLAGHAARWRCAGGRAGDG